MGVFKYSKQIAASNCGVCPPPARFTTVASPIKAVRFACEKQPCEKDFLPVLVLKPTRKLGPSHERRCSGFALSFFESVERAKSCLRYLAANSPKAVVNWQYCHQTVINPGDGVVSPVDVRGHFDLHEYDHVKLELQSTFLEAL